MSSVEIEQAVASFRDRLESYAPFGELDAHGAERIGRDAADFVAARSLFQGELATRIGPVYDTEQLSRWLAPPDHPLTSEAVRKRAKQRRLITFQADDRTWLFPAWQFDALGGVLVPHPELVALWQALPHDSWMSAANLAVWLCTDSRTLGGSPADFARRHSATHPRLLAVIARLHARVQGTGT